MDPNLIKPKTRNLHHSIGREIWLVITMGKLDDTVLAAPRLRSAFSHRVRRVVCATYRVKGFSKYQSVYFAHGTHLLV